MMKISFRILFPMIMLWRMIKWWLTGKMVLTFESNGDGEWFVQYREYPGPYYNLQMVSGADTMCNSLYQRSKRNDKEFSVIVSRKKPNRPHDLLSRVSGKDSTATYGRYYHWIRFPDITTVGRYMREIWLCPVTVYTFGNYPEFLYLQILIKK